MEKKSFILYTDNLTRVRRLSDAQAGLLFKALMEFADSGEEQVLDDPVADVMYGYISEQMTRDRERYESTCKRRSENAKKRWAKQTVHLHANAGDTDTVTEHDTENEHDTDTEHVTEHDTVTVCDTDTERLPAQSAAAQQASHTAHTQQSVLSAQEVQELAKAQGYLWSRKEAERFLAYNRDKRRTENWEFAVQKWEQNRPKYASGTASPDRSLYLNDAEMQKYVDVATMHFRQKYEDPVTP